MQETPKDKARKNEYKPPKTQTRTQSAGLVRCEPGVVKKKWIESLSNQWNLLQRRKIRAWWGGGLEAAQTKSFGTSSHYGTLGGGWAVKRQGNRICIVKRTNPCTGREAVKYDKSAGQAEILASKRDTAEKRFISLSQGGKKGDVRNVPEEHVWERERPRNIQSDSLRHPLPPRTFLMAVETHKKRRISPKKDPNRQCESGERK